MRLQLAFLAALAILAPLTARAETLTVLSLREGETNVQWQVFKDMIITRRPDGLELTAGSQTGVLIADITLGDSTDAKATYAGFPHAVGVVTNAVRAGRIYFAWHSPGDVPGSLTPFPLDVPTGRDTVTYALLHRSPQWNPGVDQVALMIPPGMTVLVKEVTFIRWSLPEKIWHGFLSLLSFDTYKLHAINFVWGPQITWNPIHRSVIWNTLPPSGFSGTYALNLALLACLVAVFVLLFRHKRLTQDEKRLLFARRAAMLVLGAWIVLDLRMGAELLTWFSRDFRSYVVAEEGERTLRNFGRFHDFAEFVRPLVADRKSYVLFTPRAYPEVPHMRYFTYPAVPGQDTNDDMWVIYNRPDIAVINSRLTLDGQPVTDEGTVIGRFDDASFVFQVSP